MKVKSDFVTNSSSVSFIIEKSKLDYLNIHKFNKLKKTSGLDFYDDEWSGEQGIIEVPIGDRDRDDIEHRIEVTLKKLGIYASCGYIDRDR